jgi:DNA polymerase-3 subunit alpha
MDKETIAQWSEGIVASTGCPSGEVQTRLRLGHFDEALKAASEY